VEDVVRRVSFHVIFPLHDFSRLAADCHRPKNGGSDHANPQDLITLTEKDGGGRMGEFYAAWARMAELADALGSGPSSRKGVEVRVLFRAPNPKNLSLYIP